MPTVTSFLLSLSPCIGSQSIDAAKSQRPPDYNCLSLWNRLFCFAHFLRSRLISPTQCYFISPLLKPSALYHSLSCGHIYRMFIQKFKNSLPLERKKSFCWEPLKSLPKPMMLETSHTENPTSFQA